MAMPLSVGCAHVYGPLIYCCADYIKLFADVKATAFIERTARTVHSLRGRDCLRAATVLVMTFTSTLRNDYGFCYCFAPMASGLVLRTGLREWLCFLNEFMHG